MTHYTVANAPTPRYEPHAALSDVRAALRDCLKTAAALRVSGNQALAIGRAHPLSARGPSYSVSYDTHAMATTKLARTAATRRALHLLYGMLRGHQYGWLEATTGRSNRTHSGKIYDLARRAIAEYTDKTFATNDFNLPSAEVISGWMRGAKPTWLTVAGAKAPVADLTTTL